MCGVLGIASPTGTTLSLSESVLGRMTSRSHRGPDGARAWRHADNLVLAHHRLAVIDPTQAGAQPMVFPPAENANPACALVYNGELYNDHALRQSLTREGATFRSACDTETILHALRLQGSAALATLRGMYALAFFDRSKDTLLLARDPLGIKPLYYWQGRVDNTPHIIFASEPQAILAHPGVPVRPDAVTISSYLTTIRTTLGERTLFEDVRAILPGQWLEFDLASPDLAAIQGHVPIEKIALPDQPPPELVAEALRDSVAAHLRSDVPLCCLLSGGLDSTAIVSIARESIPDLSTYCVGAREGCDVEAARRVAREMGTNHTTITITPELFLERWGEIIDRTGQPMSTPNEVAINEVARRIRADGYVVTLSGEGADELLGGYELPMRDALAYVRTGGDDPGAFQLESNAWIPPAAKVGLLTDAAWARADEDRVLYSTYRSEFERLRAEAGMGTTDDARAADHLRFHRRVNLAGLLLRLDSAMMLESVEGRTPFADARVAALCESLPMPWKFRLQDSGRAETKRALREAFRSKIPDEAVCRPKASFPLPFQSWIAPRAHVPAESALMRELFLPPAIEAVKAQPERLWNLAWPMINLAMWGRRWWG